MSEDIGPWAQLCKGYRYDYMSGVIHGDLSVRDIAWTLAHLPRYNAWPDLCQWSLASHTCLVAEILAANPDNSPSVILAGLNHDDHEILTGDMIRPFLVAIRSLSEDGYTAIRFLQGKAQGTIMKHLGLDWLDTETRGGGEDRSIWGRLVSQADLAALEAERRLLFSERLTWGTEEHVDPKMLADGERNIRSDFGKIAYGPMAAERWVSRFEALTKLAVRS